MTKGADNDNVLSSVVAQSHDEGNWPTYGPGSTALATDPTSQSASAESDQEPETEDFADIDLSATEDEPDSTADAPATGEIIAPEVTPPEVTATEDATTDDATAEDTGPVETGRSLIVPSAHPFGAHFGVSEAATLAALGLTQEQRSTNTTALQVFIDLKSEEAAQRRSQRRVGSANPHLFNTQPDLKAGVEAGARAAFAAAPQNTGPLTAQPGFLAGLIAAAVIGAGLYAYLV